jgi:ribosome maturation protein SDO1
MQAIDDDNDELQILDKGELQVSEKERQAQNESSFKEVADTIAGMCVDPDTKRPYAVSVIEKALHEMHFSMKPNRSAKQQVLLVYAYMMMIN